MSWGLKFKRELSARGYLRRKIHVGPPEPRKPFMTAYGPKRTSAAALHVLLIADEVIE